MVHGGTYTKRVLGEVISGGGESGFDWNLKIHDTGEGDLEVESVGKRSKMLL